MFRDWPALQHLELRSYNYFQKLQCKNKKDFTSLCQTRNCPMSHNTFFTSHSLFPCPYLFFYLHFFFFPICICQVLSSFYVCSWVLPLLRVYFFPCCLPSFPFISLPLFSVLLLSLSTLSFFHNLYLFPLNISHCVEIKWIFKNYAIFK